jgi:hypothetical protein
VDGIRVSLQVAILKVLASYPDGRASVVSMKADLAILAGAGPAWTERLKRLAEGSPNLDIFGYGLVIRDDDGWQLTDASTRLYGSSRSRHRQSVRSSFGETLRSSLRSTVQTNHFEQLRPLIAAGGGAVRPQWTGRHKFSSQTHHQLAALACYGLTSHPGWWWCARPAGAASRLF